MNLYREAARDVPVADESEVVVCGGGPAGVAAAIAAARAGARTRLLEVHGCLGGVWTAGLLSWIIDAANKPGIMREITDTLERRGARTQAPRTNNYAYDPEAMKLLLEEMCLEAGIEVCLHTRVVAAARDAANRLAVVVTESKSGRQAWAGRAFVDATGDGDLAAQVGCDFDLGRPESGQCQPMSLIVLVAGIDADEVAEFIGGGIQEPKARLLAEMQRAGVAPSYGGPTLFRLPDGLFALMANHEYGASALDTAQITWATLRARAEVNGVVAGLRALGGRWQHLRVVATGAQIGVREGRRVHGRYTVGVDDVVEGARHEDAVCRVTFGVDVHSPDPAAGKTVTEENRRFRVQPYDIPLRALIARDVDGLLLAGRCISGDLLAHSSYRVTGNAVAMGQAAGATAALSARTGCLPHELAWPDVAATIAKGSRG